jgi:FKBP-type peptidyl-prolyl cis-trans isomerase FkpA
MKRINYLLLIIAALSLTVACNQVSYKKTKTGLLYKIFSGKGKDSLIKTGQIAKFHYTLKLNDSLLFTSYGKLPGYQRVDTSQKSYNLLEILSLMKKGDSAITVQMTDTLMKQGAQLPPNTKKGDRLVTTFRILEVYKSDSLAQADYNVEAEKDRPRQMKEQEEQMAKMQKEQQEQQLKEEQELEKSGEVAKELKEMEAYLAAKKIKAQKTGKGTYVYIQQQGTGPAAETGKYVNVKYVGKILATDSTFQSNSYAFQLGKGAAIRGWDEGLPLFKEGGKGTLYIPGFLAYGKNPRPGSPFKPFEALKFDVEVLEVSDSVIAQQPMR